MNELAQKRCRAEPQCYQGLNEPFAGSFICLLLFKAVDGNRLRNSPQQAQARNRDDND